MRPRSARRILLLCGLAGALLTASGAGAEAPAARAAFLKLIDRPRVALAPEVKPATDRDGFQVVRFSYASDAAQRVPGLLIKPRGVPGKAPVVIALHGTGGTKEGEISLLKELAAKGFLAVAIDSRYHGERTRAGKGSEEYNEAILRAYQTGQEHPFLYDTVWDVMRLIDYLETRSDADSARIGLYGTSKGGMEAYLAAAVDPRIRVAVPCIGVQSFRWALDHDSWSSRAGTFAAALNGAAKESSVPKVDAVFLRRFYDKVAPGVYSDFDGPAMLPLIAPRPLLTINGGEDARTPIPGLMECINAAKAAYAGLHASDRFEFLIEEKTGHKVLPEARQKAIEWFARWLKPSA